MASNQSHHIVFMNIKATGHVNPTLSIVAELKSRGHQITYFVDEQLQGVAEAAGATWKPLNTLSTLDEAGIAKYVPQGTPKERYEGRPQCSARDAELHLPSVLEDLKGLQPPPTAIVYDPFVSFGRVAAHVLQVPAICCLTMPGPASLAKPKHVQDAWESEPWVMGPRQAVIDTYGFDIFEQGMPMESYSPVLNLVTTIDDLFMPPAEGHQQERFGSFPFKMVGLLANPSVKRIGNANVKSSNNDDPESVLHSVDLALKEERKLIYISLGTVATSDLFYDKVFGRFGKDNGLAEVTGRQVAKHVFQRCYEAFGNNDDLIVALSLGPQEDVLDGLPPMPANFIARPSLPQLELLKRCSAFITHAGANSMHESLGHGVPMIVVPFFADQPLNGDAIVNCGAGFNFRMPMETLTTEALREAMNTLLAPGEVDGEANKYIKCARTMAKKIENAGGAGGAVDLILQAMRNWEEQKTLESKAPPTLLGNTNSKLYLKQNCETQTSSKLQASSVSA